MKFSIFDLISGVEFWAFLALAMFFGFFIKYFGFNVDPGAVSTNFSNLWLLSPDYLVLIMQKILPFSFLLIVLLVFVVIRTSNKIIKIQNKMHEDLILPKFKNEIVVPEVPQKVENEKWQKVLVHINSNNPSDWKLAILECDIMLGDILEKMGYMQESIGEKLKAVEPSDFTSIESAWEAHKIRNAIAHEGSEFLINEREAKRVIGLYEVVFREFDFI